MYTRYARRKEELPRKCCSLQETDLSLEFCARVYVLCDPRVNRHFSIKAPEYKYTSTHARHLFVRDFFDYAIRAVHTFLFAETSASFSLKEEFIKNVQI